MPCCAYDAVGNLISTEDPLGRTTTYSYDALDRRTGITDALGRTTTSTYDAVGNLLSIQDPNGNIIKQAEYTYDVYDRRIAKSVDNDGDGAQSPETERFVYTNHIFRNSPGHLADTPSNRILLRDVANDPATTLGPDQFGKTWSARTLPDGRQVWVATRNGVIENGGVNSTPKQYDKAARLSKNKQPRGGS